MEVDSTDVLNGRQICCQLISRNIKGNCFSILAGWYIVRCWSTNGMKCQLGDLPQRRNQDFLRDRGGGGTDSW